MKSKLKLDLCKIPDTPDKLPGPRTDFSSEDVAMATSASDKTTSELLEGSSGGIEVLRKSSKYFSVYGWLLIAITLFGCVSYLFGFKHIVAMTPLYLIANFYLFFKDAGLQKRDFTVLSAGAAIGFLAEVIGVNTGLLFGNYHYGAVLGPALFGVPVIIGLLWAMLCGCIWSFLPVRLGIKRILVVSALSATYDLVLERFATRFGLWTWAGALPISNYVGWAIVSAGIGLLFMLSGIKMQNNSVAKLLIPLHLLFFVTLMASK